MSMLDKLDIYQYMVIFLTVLALFGATIFGVLALINVIAAVAAAALLDILIYYWKNNRLFLPYSAVISGLFIGGILDTSIPVYVIIAASIIAIASKYLIKVKTNHIFNPANLGILLAGVIFNAFHSWWISSSIVLVVAFGLFISYRIRRLHVSLVFLLVYLPLSHILAFGFDFANILLILQSNFVIFFAFFMLIEPRTSPAGRKRGVIFGIAAALLFVLFTAIIPQHDIVLALAAANVFVPVIKRYFR